jgi:hypothetical protein
MKPNALPPPEQGKKEEENPRSFVPEKSTAHFELTEQESSKLDALFQWQSTSCKSTVVLGKPLTF